MRLALLGAFAFPLPQGSQVYLAHQARALQQAGAECDLLSYGSLPAALAPASSRSGPSFRKAIADPALMAAFVTAHRRKHFDAVLAHNAEAAVIAILARAITRIPVVYVAHTVLRYELSSYGPSRWSAALDRSGHAIDGWIARRADAMIVLSEDARELLLAAARCKVVVIPPGLDEAPDPTAELQHRVCQRAGLAPGSFALYAGNLDAYQELGLLDAAAGLLAADGLPVVVATHNARSGTRDARSGTHNARSENARHPNLRIVRLESFEEIRALHFCAQSLVLPRRRRGGFPIKLLNYMEAGRPIVAFGRIAPGLENGRSACLLDEGAGPEQLARRLRELGANPGAAASLGQAARRVLRERHVPRRLAEQTLAFVSSLERGPDQAPSSTRGVRRRRPDG